MIFDPYNCYLKDSGVHRDSNSHSGSSLGNVEVHSLTLPYTFKSMKCDFWASFLAHTFVSPCLSREFKARVVTYKLLCCYFFLNINGIIYLCVGHIEQTQFFGCVVRIIITIYVLGVADSVPSSSSSVITFFVHGVSSTVFFLCHPTPSFCHICFIVFLLHLVINCISLH